jgi:catechol 2,3-dioxygenase-like lactoylglutathione lyase family enzyme
MINGAHVIVLSKKPDADRAFFRDVLGLEHVDVGGGWLIFALPPAEVAVHPSDRDSVHEFYLMCEDVDALTKTLAKRGIECGPIEDQGWGLLTSITLPGGGKLGAYEPRHERPLGKAKPRASGRAETARKVASKRRPPAKAKKTVSKTPARKMALKKAPPSKTAKRATGRKRR